jgi:hypothetical protein
MIKYFLKKLDTESQNKVGILAMLVQYSNV